MSSFTLRTPTIFASRPEVVGGITIRQDQQPPYQDTNFGYRSLKNLLSLSNYHAISKTALANRRAIITQTLGDAGGGFFAHQTHSDHVTVATTANDLEGTKEADAIITQHPQQLIGVFLADCAGILLYEPQAKIIAAIHSGWRGTKANIVSNTISQMKKLGANPAQILAYVSPVACPIHYEVGPEFTTYFDRKFLPVIDGKLCFDNQAAVEMQLRKTGVQHIELDKDCTIENPKLHSYRRDGQQSGRFTAFIGLK